MNTPNPAQKRVVQLSFERTPTRGCRSTRGPLDIYKGIADLSRIFILLLGIFISLAQAADIGRAAMWGDDGVVSFWQTNLIGGGQGSCVVKFMFDAAALKQPITNFVLTVRVIGPKNENLGVGTFEVLGGLDSTTTATRYSEAMFEGIPDWNYPGKDAGESSPLCWPSITLSIVSAAGKQGGRQVDLVESKQLVLREFQRVKIKIGK